MIRVQAFSPNESRVSSVSLFGRTRPFSAINTWKRVIRFLFWVSCNPCPPLIPAAVIIPFRSMLSGFSIWTGIIPIRPNQRILPWTTIRTAQRRNSTVASVFAKFRQGSVISDHTRFPASFFQLDVPELFLWRTPTIEYLLLIQDSAFHKYITMKLPFSLLCHELINFKC